MKLAASMPSGWARVSQRLADWLPGARKPAMPAAAPEGDGRVAFAKIAVKRIAVPVSQATPAQKRAAVRPSAGTHIPKSSPHAGTGAGGRRTLADME